MAPRRRSATPALATPAPLREVQGGYLSQSIANASTLGNAVANASTLGTPQGFTIDVAVLNMGMPTANHFKAQPAKRNEASGVARHTKK